MAELKTQKNKASVENFLKSVADETRRADCFKLLDIMRDITGEEPAMWGDSIVGFGSYHYKYESGREGDWMLTGFSPRKQSLTLYVMSGFQGYEEMLDKLGKHSTGKACLYIKKLDDVHLPTLKRIIKGSVRKKSA